MDLWHVPVEDLAATQQRALLRLHLKITGDTHRILLACFNNLRRAIEDATDTETGQIDLRKVDGLLDAATEIWGAAFGDWWRMFQAARRVAVWLPVGQLARLHDHYFGELSLQERRRLEEQLQIGLGYPELNEEGEWDPVFRKYGPVVRNVATRMEAILDGGAALKYSDGHTLSDRIWRWGSVTGGYIQGNLRGGIGRNDSAWAIAKKLEKELRSNERCPRWTSTRLSLTKQEIAAGDKRGLISGPTPCDSKGVAYNALRLARNEIQIAHHMATDEVFAAMPWVIYEFIRLSPDHPDIDCECPAIAEGGPNDNGSYPKGEVILPVHVQCLCYKEARLMHPKTFASKARAWMTGEKEFPALDQYMGWLGVADTGKLMHLAFAPAPVAPAAQKRRGAVPGDLFPADLRNMRKVRDLGGSTGAELWEDAQGRRFVMKRGASPEHLINECCADMLYQELGARVPRFRLYEDERGRPVKLAEFLDDTISLGDLYGRTGAADRRRLDQALEELRQHFVADALLGNWDVIGMNADNILVDADGHAWRIDNGGALGFRAQGARKRADQWNPWLRDLWSLRDPAHHQAARVYGSLGWDAIFEQMNVVRGLPDWDMLAERASIMGLDQADAIMLLDRLDQLDSLAKTTRVMHLDEWKWGYLDDFCRHLTEIRARGITAALPKKLMHSGVVIRDEHGMEWDRLRGRQSVIHDVDEYMQSLGGSWETTSYWMRSQGGNSWNGAPHAVKHWLVDQRTVSTDHYWWKGTPGDAEHAYEQALRALGKQYAGRYGHDLSTMKDAEIRAVGEQMWNGSYPVLHAFQYELLQTVDFERNRREDGIIELIRTESHRQRTRQNLVPGRWSDFPRGPMESNSIYQTVVVSGDNLTMHEVPHHRVLGSYMFEQMPGSFTSPFYGDSENEVMAMLEGVPTYYWGPVGRGRSTRNLWRDYHEEKAKLSAREREQLGLP